MSNCPYIESVNQLRQELMSSISASLERFYVETGTSPSNVKLAFIDISVFQGAIDKGSHSLLTNIDLEFKF